MRSTAGLKLLVLLIMIDLDVASPQEMIQSFTGELLSAGAIAST